MENPALGPRPAAPDRPPRALPRAQAALWELLRARSTPASLAELAEASGSHENTVREQLHALLRAGAVRRYRATPSGRGRPAWLYEATADQAPGTSEYAALAVTLAAFLSETSTSPWSDAVQAGRRWGRDLVADGADGDSDGTDAEPPGSRTGVIAMLEGLGFAPEVGGEVVRLTRCPLLDAARRYPDVVCGIHLGLVEGALAERGASVDGVRLTPFAEPGACLLELPSVTMAAS